MLMKDLEQKYYNTFFKIKNDSSGKETICKLIYVHANEIDEGAFKVSTEAGDTVKIDVPSDQHTLILDPPKGGFVNLGHPADPFIILRNAEKQYSRGFGPGSHAVWSLPSRYFQCYKDTFYEIQVDWAGFGKKEFAWQIGNVVKMYNRWFPTIDVAVTRATLGVALSRKFAIVRPVAPCDGEWELFRETAKIGYLLKDKKQIHCHPLYSQEVRDYLRRNSNVDWGVYEKV
jgi:hypothetical protein